MSVLSEKNIQYKSHRPKKCTLPLQAYLHTTLDNKTSATNL